MKMKNQQNEPPQVSPKYSSVVDSEAKVSKILRKYPETRPT